MIDELILREKERSISKLNEYESKVQEVEKLKEMKNALESKLKERRFGNSYIGGPFREEKFNAFQKRFSKKYKDYLKRKEQYDKKQKDIEQKNKETENLKNELKDIEQKIDNLSSEIAKINVQEIKQKISSLQDKNFAIEVLVKEDESLSQNIEFMQEAVNLDSKFIRYDRTDNPELYIKVLEIAKEKYSAYTADQNSKIKMEQEHDENIDRVIAEIKNPKIEDSSKYKIPIKYIFEGIREDLEVTIASFSRCDGVFPKEFGEELQKMYEDEENIFAVHGINRGFDAEAASSDTQYFEGKKVAEEKVESIFQKGLKATNHMHELMGHNINPRMSATTYSKGQSGFCFLKALDYKYAGSYGYILIQVPKKGMGKDAEIAIWGSKTNTEERAEQVFLLPQYIKGFVENNKRIKYEDYHIRKNDCKTIEEYPYYLMDGSYSGRGPAFKSQDINKEVTSKDIAEADKEQVLTTIEVENVEGFIKKLPDRDKEKAKNNELV